MSIFRVKFICSDRNLYICAREDDGMLNEICIHNIKDYRIEVLSLMNFGLWWMLAATFIPGCVPGLGARRISPGGDF